MTDLLVILALTSLFFGEGSAFTNKTQSGSNTGQDLVEVRLASGGKVIGKSRFQVESFNGIPFADAPVGELRLKPPKPFSGNIDTLDCTGVAPACPQFILPRDALNGLGDVVTRVLEIPFLRDVGTGQEDCLTVNVQRPAGTKVGDDLPVLFWIYGGAFQFGSTNTYDATGLLTSAVEQRQPFIFVAVNYRINGFGFLPGKEILQDGSANLGLLDQRLALKWVADNVAAFGGDARKVTIWGESAGSISVLDQMMLFDGNTTYKGRPLFRGGIMNSGTIMAAEPVDGRKGQAVYDNVVAAGGCSTAQDTLKCLRQLDFDTFRGAVNSQPGFDRMVSPAYLPRPDGRTLTASPDQLILEGKYHAVPMIMGDQEDEGTLFALFMSNVTTQADAVEYLAKMFGSNKTDKLQEYINMYRPAITSGSPFRTGFSNELYPGFKRNAAVFGDFTFTLSRRLALSAATKMNPGSPIWSFLSSYSYGLPILGTFHASDLLEVFYTVRPNYAAQICRKYYFNFLYNGDPNNGTIGLPKWPLWKEAEKLMWFRSPVSTDIMDDNFRSAQAEFLAKNSDSFKL